MTMADDANIDDSLVTSESTNPTSGPPPRKRRRPALSCEQCRKRKIKCDRNYPCNHCLQSKTATCTYSADNATAYALEVASTTTTGAGFAFPTRTKKNPSSITSSTHQSSDAASPRATTHSEGLRSSYHSPNTDPDHDDESRRALLTRIRDLESRLAKSHQEEDDVPKDDFLLRSHDSLLHGLERAQLAPDTFEGKNLRGTVSKTRFFGQSHWMYSYGAFERIACMTVDPAKNAPDFITGAEASQVKDLLEKCKAMARAAKAGPHKQWLLNPNFRESIPSREMVDKLVNLYFRTCESIHRILHIPTFQREYTQYWENPAAANTVFVMKLMLVMSIGACFYQASDAEKWHNQALQWIYAAQSWLSSPFEKGRLHISGAQIHCLVLLARLDNAVAGDLVWISAGALLRMAFQMGFHRDPKFLPPMSQLHAELRRRLWATIVDINVQSALDSGMPPLLAVEDSDTEPPANIDDVDIDENSKERAVSRPEEVYTQTSLQLKLGTTLRERLEIVRHANSVRMDPSYDEALALGTSLTKALKANNAFLTRINASSTSPTPPISQLQRNLLDLYVRRFLLAVHRPFAARAPTDPRFYFSRKVCLDCSMTIISYPSDTSDVVASPGYRDDYTWLKTMSGGFQKGFIVHAAMVIFSELLTQIDEDDGSAPAAAREPLKQALRDIIALAAERIKLVENNVKGHLFISIVLAQVEAMERGTSIEKAVLGAAKSSLTFCLELLRERIRKSLSDEEYAAIVDRNAPVAEMKMGSGLGDGDGDASGGSAESGASGTGGAGVHGNSNENGSGNNFGGMTLVNALPSGFNFGFGMGMGVAGGQDWGADFGMQDWNSAGSGVDLDYTMPDSWLLTGWEDGQLF